MYFDTLINDAGFSRDRELSGYDKKCVETRNV